MKTNFKLTSKTAVIISLFLLTSCINSHKKTLTEKESIKVGAILPLTGNQSFFGENEKNGLLFAIDQINTTQGKSDKKNIEIIFEDSKGIPSDAITAAKKLIEIDKVNFIFTSLSGVSNAVSSITKGNNILQFAFAMDDRITLGNDHVFRTYPGTKELAIKLSQIEKNTDKEKLAIIYPQQSGYESVFQEFLIPSLKEKGFKIELVDVFDMKNLSATFRGLTTKIREKKISILYLGAYYSQMPEIFRILEESNLLNNITVITEFNLQVAVLLKTIDPLKLSNVKMVIPAYGLYEGIETTDSLNIKAYILKYSKNPNYDVAFAFDAMKILSKSINVVGETPDSIINYMKKIKDYKGMSGKISIDSNNNWQTQWIIGRYSNGNLVTKEE